MGGMKASTGLSRLRCICLLRAARAAGGISPLTPVQQQHGCLLQPALLLVQAVLHPWPCRPSMAHHSTALIVLDRDSPRSHKQAVAFPASTEEVSRIVRAAAAHRTPIVPFGAGTRWGAVGCE